MIDATTKCQLLEFAFWLATKQRRCGSWVSRLPTLQSVVITCQSILLLAKFHGSFFKRHVDRAMGWLTDPEVANSEYAYWRTLPLIIGGCADGPIREAYEHTCDCVREGLQHHKKSPLHPFYVECALRLEEMGAPIEQLLDEFRSQLLDPLTNLNPAALAYRLEVVAMADPEAAGRSIKNVAELLQRRGTRDGSFLVWSNLVETDYVAMSLCEALAQLPDGHNCETLKKLLRHAGSYLEYCWLRQDFESPPLAGGNFQGTPYAKIVAARALTCLCTLDDPHWQVDAWTKAFQSRKKRQALMLSLTILLGIAVIIIGEVVLPGLTTASEPGGGAWNWIARIADIVGICTIGVGLLRWRLSRMKDSRRQVTHR